MEKRESRNRYAAEQKVEILREALRSYLHVLTSAGFAKRLMFDSDHMYWPDAIGLASEAIESAPFPSKADKNDIFYCNSVRFKTLEA